jgi:hypothetical protein
MKIRMMMMIIDCVFMIMIESGLMSEIVEMILIIIDEFLSLLNGIRLGVILIFGLLGREGLLVTDNALLHLEDANK